MKKIILKRCQKKVIEKIKNSGFLPKRLLFAYPDFKHIGIVIGKKARSQKEKYTNKQKQIIKDAEVKIEKIGEKYKKKYNK